MKHRDRRGGERRTGLGFGVVIGVVAAAGMLAACGGGSSGPQVASLGSDATTTTVKSASATGKGDPLAFSRCMRAHGLPDFPDPDPNGGITINSGGPGGKNLGPDAPAFKAAQKACASLAPGGGAATPAEKAKRRAEGLKMAQCMRAHGILDFPDPSADGGSRSKQSPGVISRRTPRPSKPPRKCACRTVPARGRCTLRAARAARAG